jgi:hypothetical protein
MQAAAGDHIIIRGHRINEAAREAVVLEARGADNHAPFMVRWLDDGHEGLFFPGPDAVVKHQVDEPA